MSMKHQERTERAFQLAISRNSNGGGASFTTDEKAQKALWEIAKSLAAIADALDPHNSLSAPDICAIHLSPRAVEEDPRVCWEYDGKDDCLFATTHDKT